MNRTLVIAEPGCTHEGSWTLLADLLRTAKECGADVWKPQWTSDPVQMLERRHIGPDHKKRKYYERAYRWLNFPVEWHADFKAICDKIGLQYAVTCFLPQDVATVAPYVDYLKIASFEARDEALAMKAERVGCPLLISTGMLGNDEEWWFRGNKLLHCVSSYPAPLESLNIRAVMTCGYDGFSDHSRHLLSGALAVAMGADFVETHYRLASCDPNNPDFAVSWSPGEFTQYVQNIRDAEVMLGNGVKTIQDCERWALSYRVVS